VVTVKPPAGVLSPTTSVAATHIRASRQVDPIEEWLSWRACAEFSWGASRQSSCWQLVPAPPTHWESAGPVSAAAARRHAGANVQVSLSFAGSRPGAGTTSVSPPTRSGPVTRRHDQQRVRLPQMHQARRRFAGALGGTRTRSPHRYVDSQSGSEAVQAGSYTRRSAGRSFILVRSDGSSFAPVAPSGLPRRASDLPSVLFDERQLMLVRPVRSVILPGWN